MKSILCKAFACSAAVLLSVNAFGQSVDGIHFLDEFRKPTKRKIIQIPDVNGYKVLKTDFHMHTVFSDGRVWPDIRIKEAEMEGLDAIAYTEHAEYTPHAKDVSENLNRPHELVEQMAREKNIILVKGIEITRKTAPGHFNALFIGDANHYVKDQNSDLDSESMKRAEDQKAFVFWNHPGWQRFNAPGSYEWIPFVDSLTKKNVIQGIEVINGFGIHEKSIDWALQHNLTMMGTSDMHDVVGYDYDLEKEYVHRAMTLVLAKERSAAGIREALEARRTIAWASKYLIGKEELLLELMKSCLTLSPSFYAKEQKTKDGKRATVQYYELKNNSDLYFEMQLKEGNATKKVLLYPNSSEIVVVHNNSSRLSYEVTSAFVGTKKHLIVDLFTLAK